ncbi:MAG TPA: DsbA family protein [Thermodesulfobacteriota bacterium]|jgi:protein-disulfide isomerase
MKIFLGLITVGVLISIALSAWILLELESVKSDISVRNQEISSAMEDLKKLAASRPDARPASPTPARPQNVTVSIDDDPVKGDPKAPVTVIEFSDYQCPFCKRFYDQVLPSLENEYISKGKVRLVFRDYPLDFHKNALPAAIAANCAGEQGKYWEVHNFLFENPNKLDTASILSSTEELNLNRETLEKCVNDKTKEAEINKDFQEGQLYGVRGTPSFFVGKTDDNKNEMTGVYIRGAQPFQVFKAEIDKLLAEK